LQRESLQAKKTLDLADLLGIALDPLADSGLVGELAVFYHLLAAQDRRLHHTKEALAYETQGETLK